jgi:hypothetical protein
MEKVEILELEDNLSGEKYDWVVIRKNDVENVGMLKSTYDELKANEAETI